MESSDDIITTYSIIQTLGFRCELVCIKCCKRFDVDEYEEALKHRDVCK